MKIYTGSGDEGMTGLRDGSRISKTSPRIEAYGTVDELNALIGTIRPTEHDEIDDILSSVQNHLHILQAEFANPDSEPDDPQIRSEHVDTIESWIDEHEESLEPLQSFILPTGSESGSKLHYARTVCRRAERRAVAFAADNPVNDQAMVYLNRLSDLLFVLGRVVNSRDGVEEESPTY
ncbi:cob(I)yrinic acid a,c-diamide adenosyltransferase [Salinarchaeum sp. IM2453]|uniref:cob(I)yrinic acid a,c-diamide adenosyltransferase n=1 Tax=Salinarchaeum sp. IM2453 TaxID=2862870 RepID=UPI001C83C159|nr:cob(I)yrinic acid a,c-diamide adenosyltransferase [Salinarchaeum sp. IM2453]QZA89270.1 cob(I)yrinic acid a,c-diamide adenosyltransferase [Salinarchaeum sp. IM2453]